MARKPSGLAATKTRKPMLRAIRLADASSVASTGACEMFTISCATKSKGRATMFAASASSSSAGRSRQNTGRCPSVG